MSANRKLWLLFCFFLAPNLMGQKTLSNEDIKLLAAVDIRLQQFSGDLADFSLQLETIGRWLGETIYTDGVLDIQALNKLDFANDGALALLPDDLRLALQAGGQAIQDGKTSHKLMLNEVQLSAAVLLQQWDMLDHKAILFEATHGPQAAEALLRAWLEYQRKVMTLKLLRKASDPVLSLFGLPSRDFVDYLEILDKPIPPGDEADSVIEEQRRARASLEDIQLQRERFEGKLEEAIAPLKAAMEQPLNQDLKLDFGEGEWRFRLRFEGESHRVNGTILGEARLVYVNADHGVQRVSVKSSNNKEQIDKEYVNQAIIEEVDTGIHFLKVICTLPYEGGNPSFRVPFMQARTTLDINQQTFQSFLRRVGAPCLVALKKTLLEVNDDLTQLTFSLTIPLPGLDQNMDHKLILDLTQPKSLEAQINQLKVAVTHRYQDALNAMAGKAINALLDGVHPYTNMIIETIEWLDDQRKGDLLWRVHLNSEGLGRFEIPVRVSWKDTHWRASIDNHDLPAQIVERMRTRWKDELEKLLKDYQPWVDAINAEIEQLKQEQVRQTRRLKNAAREMMANYLTIDYTQYDPEQQRLTARLCLKVQDFLCSTVSFDPRNGVAAVFEDPAPMLRTFLEEQVKDQLALLVKNFADQLFVTALDKLRQELENLDPSFTVLGCTTKAVFADDPKKRGVMVNLDGDCGELGSWSLENLRLVLPRKASFDGLSRLVFDYSEAVSNPSIAEILEQQTASNYLSFSKAEPRPDGLVTRALLSVPELDLEANLGEFVVSHKMASLDTDSLETMTKEALGRLLQKQLDFQPLRDLGPIKSVALDQQASNILDGRIVFNVIVDSVVDLPFRVVLDPNLRIEPPDETMLQDALLGYLGNTISLGAGAGLEISNLQLTAPYKYIQLDLNLKLDAGGMGIGAEMTGLRIDRDGVDLPDDLHINLGTPLPVPPVFSIQNPGIIIGLSSARVGVSGEFSVEGLHPVAKVAAKILVDLETQAVHLRGDLILFESLPVFIVKGEVNLPSGRLVLDARTTPVIDPILKIRSHLKFTNPILTIDGSLAILGLDMFDAALRMNIKERSMYARGNLNILIGEASVEAEAGDGFSNPEAGLSVEAKVGGAKLSKTSIRLSTSSAKLKFRALGFDITVITPGMEQVTPGLILDILAGLLKIDVKALLEALSKDITISLIPPGGGEGGIKEEETAPNPPGGKPENKTNISQNQEPGPPSGLRTVIRGECKVDWGSNSKGFFEIWDCGGGPFAPQLVVSKAVKDRKTAEGHFTWFEFSEPWARNQGNFTRAKNHPRVQEWHTHYSNGVWEEHKAFWGSYYQIVVKPGAELELWLVKLSIEGMDRLLHPSVARSILPLLKPFENEKQFIKMINKMPADERGLIYAIIAELAMLDQEDAVLEHFTWNDGSVGKNGFILHRDDGISVLGQGQGSSRFIPKDHPFYRLVADWRTPSPYRNNLLVFCLESASPNLPRVYASQPDRAVLLKQPNLLIGINADPAPVILSLQNDLFDDTGKKEEALAGQDRLRTFLMAHIFGSGFSLLRYAPNRDKGIKLALVSSWSGDEGRLTIAIQNPKDFNQFLTTTLTKAQALIFWKNWKKLRKQDSEIDTQGKLEPWLADLLDDDVEWGRRWKARPQQLLHKESPFAPWNP